MARFKSKRERVLETLLDDAAPEIRLKAAVALEKIASRHKAKKAKANTDGLPEFFRKLPPDAEYGPSQSAWRMMDHLEGPPYLYGDLTAAEQIMVAQVRRYRSV